MTWTYSLDESNWMKKLILKIIDPENKILKNIANDKIKKGKNGYMII